MTKISNAVAAVISNANMTQAERGKRWFSVFNEMEGAGVKFAANVRKWVAREGMTIFTLADAKAFCTEYAKAYMANLPEGKSKLAPEVRAEKAAKNKLSWLRRELRASDVKVESDPRGGANNKTGANGKDATKQAEADVFKAIAMLKGYKGDLPETDQTLFMHCLARIETIEKKKRSQ